MAVLYDPGDNVVPDLQCCEMLPTDEEQQLAQAFAGNEQPNRSFKPISPARLATFPALPVALQRPVGCDDETLLQVPRLVYDGFVGSSFEPDGLEGAVSDTQPDSQTVPSLPDTPTSTPITASSHLMAGSGKSVSSSDDSTNYPMTATSTTVSHSPYEMPNRCANLLLDLLVQHREKHVKESQLAKFGDRNCGQSDLQFDGRCDCDAHLVPRWDVEE